MDPRLQFAPLRLGETTARIKMTKPIDLPRLPLQVPLQAARVAAGYLPPFPGAIDAVVDPVDLPPEARAAVRLVGDAAHVRRLGDGGRRAGEGREEEALAWKAPSMEQPW